MRKRDRVWAAISAFLKYAFSSCRHAHQSMPRRDEKGTYLCCLDCGWRIPWFWPDRFRIKPPRLTCDRKPNSAEELERIIRGAGM